MLSKFLNTILKSDSQKTKLLFLATPTLISVASAFVILKKSQNWFETEQLREQKSEVVQKMSPLKKIVHFRIEQLKNQVLEAALKRKNPNFQSYMQDFNMIAFVQNNNGVYTKKWHEENKLNDSLNWPHDYENTALQAIAYSKIGDGENAWFRLVDSSNKAYFALVLSVEVKTADITKKAFLVGVSRQNLLSGLVDDYLGSSNSVYIMNEKSYVASHTDKNLVGSLFNEQPVYKEMQKTQRTTDSGYFKDLRGRNIYAYYEKIENTNLYAVVSSSPAYLAPLLEQHWNSGFMALVALAFLVSAFSYFAGTTFWNTLVQVNSRTAENTISALSTKPENLKEPVATNNTDPIFALSDMDFNSAQFDVSSTHSLNKASEMRSLVEAEFLSQPKRSAEFEKQKFELLKQMGRGMTAILSERISGILANTQLMLNKLVPASDISKDLQEHIQYIDHEARKTRDFIKQLDHFSSDDVLDMSSVYFKDLMEIVLERVDDEIEGESIHLDLQIDSRVRVAAHVEKMQIALEHILKNAIESLRGRENKRIKVSAFIEKSKLQIQIFDNGIGMPKHVLDQIFIPFNRNFEHSDGNGLGLCVALGILQAHHGNIEIQSSPGAGTEVIVTMPAFKEVDRVEAPHLIPKSEFETRELFDSIREEKWAEVASLEPDIKVKSSDVFELNEADIDEDLDEDILVQVDIRKPRMNESFPESKIGDNT